MDAKSIAFVTAVVFSLLLGISGTLAVKEPFEKKQLQAAAKEARDEGRREICDEAAKSGFGRYRLCPKTGHVIFEFVCREADAVFCHPVVSYTFSKELK